MNTTNVQTHSTQLASNEECNAATAITLKPTGHTLWNVAAAAEAAVARANGTMGAGENVSSQFGAFSVSFVSCVCDATGGA